MFSLCRSPASIVFLDDDPDFLETLALLLPSRWRYDFYLRPAPLQERLETEAAAWTARVERRQAAVAGAGLGESLPARILRDWAEDGERYALAGICVVDYSMPAMSGLEFLERLPDWPGARILLTGRADEHIAVRAFNAGLIEQFIPKQGDDSAGRVAPRSSQSNCGCCSMRRSRRNCGAGWARAAGSNTWHWASRSACSVATPPVAPAGCNSKRRRSWQPSPSWRRRSAGVRSGWSNWVTDAG